MNGWVILDKPSGITSRKAGAICARMFGAKTFGHVGTLDPMASGLLPVALGRATKMIPFIEGQKSEGKRPKEYLFGVRFGFETDTLDITGSETARADIIPTAAQIENACKKLTGEIEQTPPAYSAVHVNGRRAYELARAGRAVEIAPRKVTVYELNALGDGRFRIVCSPGTYVRSIARDMAKLCGTLATVDMIRRIKTGGFDIKDAARLDFLENLYNNDGALEEYLKAADFGLGDIPVLNLGENNAKLFQNGGFMEVCDMKHVACDMSLRRVYSDDDFIGIGCVENGILKPKRVLN
jgi:tRNA pseudouridine55 synthase